MSVGLGGWMASVSDGRSPQQTEGPTRARRAPVGIPGAPSLASEEVPLWASERKAGNAFPPRGYLGGSGDGFDFSEFPVGRCFVGLPLTGLERVDQVINMSVDGSF